MTKKTEEKTVKKGKTTPKVNEIKTVSDPGKRIYAGPNMLGLITYTVIEGGIPAHIEKFAKECPEIEKLIVPIKDLAETEERSRRSGTLEHRNYEKVLQFKREAKK